MQIAEQRVRQLHTASSEYTDRPLKLGDARTTDSWTATSTASAPLPGIIHTAVWTGSEMIVWGG